MSTLIYVNCVQASVYISFLLVFEDPLVLKKESFGLVIKAQAKNQKTANASFALGMEAG